MSPSERIQPVTRRPVGNRLRPDKSSEPTETGRVPLENRVPRVPPTGVSEQPRLAIERLDRLTVGSHHDAKSRQLDGQNAHGGSVTLALTRYGESANVSRSRHNSARHA